MINKLLVTKWPVFFHPSFFQPDYNKWAQQRVGEMLVFVDQNGVTETFEVTKIEPNGPFQTEGRGSRERNVLCDLKVHEVLVGAESKTIFIKRFNHGEFSDRELSGETFWLTIDVVTEAKYFRPSDFSINLKRHDGFYENDFSREINFAELEIGGSLYQDVITAEVFDERFLLHPYLVRSVAIDNGFGLVQYERVNGSVFSLVLE